jgi:pimeloyl-ACP methyl ester carboxylesterase
MHLVSTNRIPRAPSLRPRGLIGAATWRVLVAVLVSVDCAYAQAPESRPVPAQKATSAIRPEATFDVKYLDVQIEGQPLRMAYRDVMPVVRAEQPAVLLLHGKNFSGFYWEPTIRELVASGNRVVAPDQIGFGESSKPDIHYSFHLLARLTAELLDRLGVRRVVVVGHSMGGMLATRFALLYPERVAKLVLENPIGLEDYRALVPYTPIEDQIREESAATFERMLAYQKGYYAHWRAEYEIYAREQAKWIATGEWPRVARANALTYEMICTQPVVYEFSHLKVPTLLVIGQSDRTVVGKAKMPESLRATAGNYPELGRQAHAAIVGSKLVEIPECGHIPHIEAHAEFVRALVDWLR